MPELPEVETTRRGIAPHLQGHQVREVIVRQRQLRWPIPRNLNALLRGQTIEQIDRRGKYLLLGMDTGTLILHLGMSGSLRILPATTPVQKHDHLDIVLDNGQCLRLRDPRRFGAVLWTRKDPARHKLLQSLGPEPLSDEFDGDYLWQRSRGRKLAIKSFVMDSKIVTGVGNIYANEALFIAGIHPQRAAGRISRERYQQLAVAIKQVLEAAIREGGTTLRDFTASDGKPGYFRLKLHVYERDQEPCHQCGKALRQIVIAQRSTYYCQHCQR
ncbi:MAG: bifunctional DNA-formamidopyrimidine glycosylase/DNA-(apurinic or apyrimidinic site) lyase [Thiohalophilus sp.]|uniref:bifunctional DNA-formamidopyrimidine glycosylase/DNA-(apurinic or apyrimidinic site) lyase n=1 Tax=Thiohalophilus sp. TaxID=3028392 RepID=UPI00286FF8C0|nr:bifunctional DNA-formamidopyrimidine glycosylase/DNA-(apurinic or apyrimidinic site) lyase [Thiohalophilus sp.]MDR9435502.1 bifunctional DNA-formamidopyrimidine glycosylase/DNA-(apurinic or apyrimidinic site) lyase [Thiohalophilus sp.]